MAAVETVGPSGAGVNGPDLEAIGNRGASSAVSGRRAVCRLRVEGWPPITYRRRTLSSASPPPVHGVSVHTTIS